MKKFLTVMLIVIVLAGGAFGVYWLFFRNKDNANTPDKAPTINITMSEEYSGPSAQIKYNASKTKFQIVVDDTVNAGDESEGLDATETAKFTKDNLLYFANGSVRYDYSFKSELSTVSSESQGYWYAVPNSTMNLTSHCSEIGFLSETNTLVLPRETTLDDLDDYLSKLDANYGADKVETLILPARITTLTNEIKNAGLVNIKTINNNNLTNIIEESAFSGFEKLEKITTSNVTSFGKECFKGCTSLKSVSFNSAQTIGESAFKESAIKQAILSEATTISNYAFEGCTSLEKATFPAATEIGIRAFEGCTSLESVKIPTSIKKLGGNSFNIANIKIEVEGDAAWFATPGLLINNAFSNTAIFRFKNLSNSIFTATSGDELAAKNKITNSFAKQTTNLIYFANETRAYVNENGYFHITVSILGAGTDEFEIQTVGEAEDGNYVIRFKSEQTNVVCFEDANGNRYDYSDDNKTWIYSYEQAPETLTAIKFDDGDVVYLDKLASSFSPSKDVLILDIEGDDYNKGLAQAFKTFAIKNGSISLENYSQTLQIAGVTFDAVADENGNLKLTTTATATFESESNVAETSISGFKLNRQDSTITLDFSALSGINSDGISAQITETEENQYEIAITIVLAQDKKAQVVLSDDAYVTLTETLYDGNQYVVVGKKDDGYFFENGKVILDGQETSLENADAVEGYEIVAPELEALLSDYEKIYFTNKISTLKSNVLPGEYLSGVSSISLYSGTTVIEERALNALQNLTTLIIPESVKEISANAFYGCTSVEYLSTPVINLSISNMFGTALEMLTEVNFTGTELPASAFNGCTALETATIKNVIKINEYAFKDCTNLSAVNFSNVLANIKIGAFENCSSLKAFEYDINDTQTSSSGTIGPEAFKNCTQLERVVLREYISLYGTANFFGCENLSEITLCQYNADENGPLMGQFLDNDLTTITNNIPNITINWLGKSYPDFRTFSEPDTLENVEGINAKIIILNMPNISSIHSDLFVKLVGLEELYIPQVTLNFNSISNLKSLKCLSINNIDGSAEQINDLEIEKLDIAATSIPARAFAGADISGIELSFSKVETIGIGAFYGATLANVSFPELKTIGGYAFYNAKLGVLSMPKLETIGDAAFARIDATSQFGLNDEGVVGKIDISLTTKIGIMAFAENQLVTEFVFADELDSIGAMAFMGLGINSLSLPKVQNISSGILQDCTSIEALDLIYNDHVSKIYDLFQLSNASVSISNRPSFENPIIFGDVVVYYDRANYYYDYVENWLKGTKENRTVITMNGYGDFVSMGKFSYNNVRYTFSESTAEPVNYMIVAKYENTPSVSLKQINIDCDNNALKASYFESMQSAQTINVTNCTGVGAKSFKDCRSLETLTFDQTRIGLVGNNAFENCESLETLTLPQVDSFGEYVFNGVKCDLTVNSTSIGANTFSGYNGTLINLPNAKSIDANAFMSCEELETIQAASYNFNTDKCFVTEQIDGVDEKRIVIDKETKECRWQYKVLVKLSFVDKLKTNTYYCFRAFVNKNTDTSKVNNDSGYKKIFDTDSTSQNEKSGDYIIEGWVEESEKDDKITLKIEVERRINASDLSSSIMTDSVGHQYPLEISGYRLPHQGSATTTTEFNLSRHEERLNITMGS